jgi:hypothetical protein
LGPWQAANNNIPNIIILVFIAFSFFIRGRELVQNVDQDEHNGQEQ